MAIIKTIHGPYKFKQENIYVGIKKINRRIARNNLLDLKDILDRQGLYFGLMFGTLLGAVREKDFIEHDEDIDLYFMSEDEEKFKTILFDLRDAGFELIRYERRGLYSIGRNNEYIDFYSMKPFSKGVRYSGGREYVLEKYLLDTILIDFLGTKFRVPKDHIEFLEMFYGKDWRTPIIYSNIELSKSKILTSKLQVITKRWLPDILYYKLLLRYHQKDRVRFLNRCKEMNIEM